MNDIAIDRNLLPAIPQRGVTPQVVQDIEKIIADKVSLVHDVNVLDEWHSQAAALEAYFRGKELKAPMAGAMRRVEARIGQLLGDPDQTNGRPLPHNVKVIDHHERHDFRILARCFDDDRARLNEAEWRQSRRKLVALIRDRCDLIPRIVVPNFPDGPFRAIVLDPPWPIEKIEFDRRGKETMAMDYRMMSLQEIGQLPIPDLADKEGSHIYLWVTHHLLPEGLKLFDRWGVRYECVLTWNKPTAQPLWWRFLTEHCLFGKIGSLAPLNKGQAVSFSAPQQKHSHKPDQFFELVRKVSPDRRLTMFDGEREGFVQWGHVHG